MGKDIKEKPELANTLNEHSLSYSLEACDVSACNKVVAEVVLLASRNALLEDVDHDSLELRINLFLSEDSVLSVLAHLDAGASYAALAAADGQTCEGVLENLLEAEELMKVLLKILPIKKAEMVWKRSRLQEKPRFLSPIFI